MPDIFDIVAEKQNIKEQVNETKPKEDIFDRVAKKQADSKRDVFDIVSDKIRAAREERGFWPSFKSGYKGGVTGLIAGNRPEAPREDASWLESLGSMVGKFASDYPAMIPGAEVGALGGGALGSVVPGVGTGVGALLGGGAGAMALPTAIDKAFEEYYDYSDKGGDMTFGEFLERAGSVGKETGKQAIIGGATGMVSKALPVLKKIPGFEKLLNTNVGRKAVGTGLEYGTLTTGQAAMEGRTPTMQEAVNNALLLAGLKTSGAITGRAKSTDVYRTAETLVKQHPLVKSVTGLWDKMPGPVKEFGEKIKDLKQSNEEAMYFDMLKDHIGERNARTVESQFKWRNALEKYQKEKPFTKQELEEMIYYRQKTKNPRIENDTYADLSKRLSPNAKRFVDEVVGPHLEESLKLWNEHPLTRNINPREALEGIYLPGLYKDEPSAIRKAHEEVSKQFKISNPLANPKKFLTYNDAMQARGLTPRYTNMVDLMRAYDNINTRILTNLEFLNQIKASEQAYSEANDGQKLIVKSTNRKAYQQAKNEGYIPFDDVFLRRYVAGQKEVKPKGPVTLFKDTPAYREFMSKMNKEKEPIFAVTMAPALVHPDLAPALQGVFRKNPYKDPSLFWKAADALTNELKHIEVVGSLFHYGSLFQHTGGLLGAKKALQSVAPWYTEFKSSADALLNNKEVMKDAARSGLVVHRKVENLGETPTLIGRSLDKIADKLPEKVKDNRFVDWAAGKLERGMKHLFDVHHPRLKIKAWNDMVEKYAKENPGADMVEAKREIAKVVNNVYGGQNWETMRYMNNPENLNVFRRIIAFPDWTLSQIRAADVGLTGKPSIAQKEARKYWLKYGLFLGGFHGLLKWMNGGLEQTDKENLSPSGIRFNPMKAFEALDPFKQDPKNWFKVQLPDIPMKIAGKEFNPGRDEKGRRLNFQMMKSVLELGGWAFHPFVEFFHKANPLIRAAYKQIQGESPTPTGTFPVQATWDTGYKRGKPWGGSEDWTVERAQSRVKELASEFKPFSAGTITNYGLPTFIASGLGAGSVSKGLSLSQSESYIKKAVRNKDYAALNNIKRTLKDNGYTDKTIKARIRKIKNQVIKE